MNLEMQITHIERNLQRYNSLPYGLSPLMRAGNREIVWEDDLDSTLTLPENISELERLYPEYNWRAPAPEDRVVRPKKSELWKKEDFTAGPQHDCYEMNAKVTVKRHPARAKGRIYEFGRIQLTVDKKWVGKEAEVHVFIAPYRVILDPEKEKRGWGIPKKEYY